jgi:hypothetical protein
MQITVLPQMAKRQNVNLQLCKGRHCRGTACRSAGAPGGATSLGSFPSLKPLIRRHHQGAHSSAGV